MFDVLFFPSNGYGLFTSQVLSKLTDIPSNERMAEVSRRWKALKEEDREKFNKNAVQVRTCKTGCLQRS